MELAIAVGLLIVGLVILIVGAEGLVRGASSIAKRFGISPLVIGLTVVAFGTSTPELTVNMYAALSGSTSLAIGNIIGSNIANILLILGISALIVPLTVKSSTVRWEIPLALLASILVLVFGSDIFLDGGTQNVLTRTDGIAFMGLFVIFMFYVFALVRADPKSVEEPEITTMRAPVAIAYVIGGLAALILGGKLLVDNAVVIARFAGLSEAVIGLTVVAVGTSLPELATSVIAALKREADIAIGNIVGSNIFNILWILGLTSVIAPLPVPPSFAVDAWVAILATIALMLAVFVGTRGSIERWQGIAFIAAYVVYIGNLVI